MFELAGGGKRAADLVEFYEEVGYDHLIPSYVRYNWSWIQSCNLDVWVVLGVGCIVLAWVCWRLGKSAVRTCCIGNPRTIFASVSYESYSHLTAPT